MFGSEQNTTNGIGFGLLISKLQVNEFDGDIDFDSVWEEGSTFFFTFKLHDFSLDDYVPVKRAARSTKIEDLQIYSPSFGSNDLKVSSLLKIFLDLNNYNKFKENRILVVDDEEFCLSSMKAILFNMGIDTTF